MMDWILDIYDQETYRTAIIMITAFMITLFFVFVLRFNNFTEWDTWGDKFIKSLAVFSMVALLLCGVPGMYLKHKSEERREAQVEQPLVK